MAVFALGALAGLAAGTFIDLTAFDGPNCPVKVFHMHQGADGAATDAATIRVLDLFDYKSPYVEERDLNSHVHVVINVILLLVLVAGAFLGWLIVIIVCRYGHRKKNRTP